jgi:1,4-alpha-glucan branching enzyme
MSSDPLGALCIVLHGHLPYVLHHGTQPHGEAWLYEAAAETYLPLLDVIGEVAQHRARPALTIGLTPVLLEQLAHERFKSGFVAYLNERAERAAADRREFESKGEAAFAAQAARWVAWYERNLEHFERIRRDIPAEFAGRFREGHVQILTSNATHAYMPLLLNDEMCRAQMTCGTRTSERHLGRKSLGMWLPECAYRPTEERWQPAVLYDDARYRVGIEHFIAGAGVTHFFVDHHMVANGQALGTMKPGGRFDETSEAQLYWDQKRAWGSPLDPVGVASRPEPPACFAFARHPRVSEQVWSGTIGYPGHGAYLEFHRKHGEGGLRYHRITGSGVPLSDKQPYAADDDVKPTVYRNAQHFVAIVKDVLGGHKHFTGRPGLCVAPFDAELFGHWWFEGVEFLREVILALANDGQVKLLTADEALASYPPVKVMRLPEGSWGERGDHSVWLNDRTRWIWETEYRAEGRFLKLLHALPWRTNLEVRAMLERAARELMLLQASDWPFVIHTKGATDYGIERFSLHATRFQRMTAIAERVAGGGRLDELQRVQVQEADLHDSVFREIDLSWWMP